MTALALRMAGGVVALPPALAGLAWGLVATLVWGGYFAFARAGVVGGLTPIDFVLLRNGAAGLLVLPLLVLFPRLGLDVRSFAGIGWRRGLVLTVLGGPLFVFLATAGFRYAPLAHGAVIQPSAVTLSTMLLAVLLLGDRIGPRRWLGVAVVVLGLGLVSGAGMHGGAWKGDLMFAAAGLLWALFTVLSRRWRVDPGRATLAVALLGGLLAILAWGLLGDAPALLAQGWRVLAMQVLVQGLLSGLLAIFAFIRAAALLGPSRAAIFPAVVPAVATLMGIPLTGEWPTLVQWLGLATVLLGLPLAMGLLKARAGA